jgi:hypothetical protein
MNNGRYWGAKSVARPQVLCAGILEQAMEARNRVGIGLSYRPASAGIFKQSMGAEPSRNMVVSTGPPGYIGS